MNVITGYYTILSNLTVIATTNQPLLVKKPAGFTGILHVILLHVFLSICTLIK
jgi:hypothetical protein